MSHVATTCVIAALVASPVGANETQSLTEVVIADELRTAFYEHAPFSLATKMSKAVNSWCSTARSGATGAVVSWLCRGKKPVYFRSVYVNGSKGGHGLVCEDNGSSTLKYFGIDFVTELIADEVCVPAEYDGSVYTLYVEKVGRRDP